MADTQHVGAGFASTHLAMVFKYIGISFVAGAVSHGVFSGTRSLVTAGIGVAIFLLGQVLELLQSNDKNNLKRVVQSLAIGAVMAIGMGFFTGSLQHFPDSPERSLWVVPLGFAMSLAAFAWMNKGLLTGNIQRYAAASFVVVSAISLGAYQYYTANPVTGDG